MTDLAPQVVEIDGQKFRIAYLDGVAGHRLALDALRVLGAGIVPALLGENGNMAMFGIASTAPAADFERIVDTLGKVSQYEVEPGSEKWLFLKEENRRTFFRGRQKLQFSWVAQALKVQLADFFVEKTPD